MNTDYRAGYIAIIGKPNVGKSTLLNKLLDFKLSITSPRPQTTRHRIMGIMSGKNFQIIFLDTPGIIEPKYQLQRAMLNQVRSSISDADAIVFMLDDSSVKQRDPHIIADNIKMLENINVQKKPVILVINKIDLIPKADILPVIDRCITAYPFTGIVPISGLKGDGLDQLRDEFLAKLPLHPPYYDPDIITEQPEKFFVAELIREQIFHYFQKEVPYSTEVQIEEFKERGQGKDFIRAVIYTERKTQKAIIIGKQGNALKTIGRKSRDQIERFLGREVYLDLHVKLKKDWRRDDLQVRQFGYL